MPLKTPVEPVKWMPASWELDRTGLPMAAPLPGTMLMTPSGRPASFQSFMRKWAL